MTAIKSASQALEIAIRIERNGLDFYKRLSEHAGSPAERDVFGRLAAAEEKHIGLFRRILEEVADYTPAYEYPGEYGLFLNEVAALSINTFKDTTAYTTGSVKDALLLGIQAELQAILLYTEFYTLVPEKEKAVIETIIDEEKRHFIDLNNLLKETDFERGAL